MSAPGGATRCGGEPPLWGQPPRSALPAVVSTGPRTSALTGGHTKGEARTRLLDMVNLTKAIAGRGDLGELSRIGPRQVLSICGRGVAGGRLDRPRRAGKAVAADVRHRDVAVGQIGPHRHPELRALTGLKPDPQDAPDAVRVDPDGVCAALLPTLAPSRTLTTIPVGGDHRGHRVQRAAVSKESSVPTPWSREGDRCPARSSRRHTG